MSAENTTAQAAFGEPATPRRPPSPWNYALAILMAVGGIAAGVLWFISGFTSLDDKVTELQRVNVPGEKVIALSEGAQSIYFESDDGQDVAVPVMDVRITPEGGGKPLDLRDNDGDTEYSLSGFNGQSIAGFDSPKEGKYLVVVKPQTDQLPAAPVLAIGEGVGSHIVWTVVGGLGLVFGGFILAGAWIILTAYRRRRAERAAT